MNSAAAQILSQNKKLADIIEVQERKLVQMK
jgi:hypothetical protein